MSFINRLISKFKNQSAYNPTQRKASPIASSQETDNDQIAKEFLWLGGQRKEHLDKLNFWSKQTNTKNNVRSMHALARYIGKEVIVETIDLWDRRICISEWPDVSEGVLKNVLPFMSIRIGIRQPEIHFARIPFHEKPIGPIRKIIDDHDNVIYFNPLIRRSLNNEPLLFHQNVYIFAISFGWANYFKYHCGDVKRAKMLKRGIRLNIPEMEIGEHLYEFVRTPFGVMASAQALEIISAIKTQNITETDFPSTNSLVLSRENIVFWEECQRIAGKLSQDILMKTIFLEEAKGNRLNVSFLERLASILLVVQYIHPKGIAMSQCLKVYRNIFD